MNKKNEEVRNQEPKKGFVAMWDEMWQSIRKAIVPILYAIITIPGFIVISYWVCWQLMGNDLCSYDKAIYDNIEKAIADNIVVVYNTENDAVESATINTLSIMDTVDTCQSDRENGKIVLKCTVKRGYFEAIVTARISEDCQITDAKRNYNSEKEYMDGRQPIFALCVIGGGVVGWLVITAFVCLLIQILVWAKKAFTAKKAQKEKADNTDNTDSTEAKTSSDNKEDKIEDDFDIEDLTDFVDGDANTAKTSKEVPKTSE